jgi:hypothetical protein
MKRRSAVGWKAEGTVAIPSIGVNVESPPQLEYYHQHQQDALRYSWDGFIAAGTMTDGTVDEKTERMGAGCVDNQTIDEDQQINASPTRPAYDPDKL